MATLIITRGLQGSGKTTAALDWLARNPWTVRANRDLIRIELHGGWVGTPEAEQEVTDRQRAIVSEALACGVDVIADDTNLPYQAVKAWADFVRNWTAELLVWDFTHVPLEECIRRDALRTGAAHIGETIIREKWQKYVKGRPCPLPLPAGVRLAAPEAAR